MEKFKQWVVTHKIVSIVIASVLVVGLTLAIVLPITLSNKHTYSENWLVSPTHHWHECTDKDCNKTKDNNTHDFDADGKCKVCKKIKSILAVEINDYSVSNNIGAFQQNWLTEYTGGCIYDLDLYNYEYFKYGEDGTSLTSLGDILPTEVGNYRVKVTYDGDDTYLPAEAIEDFSITE